MQSRLVISCSQASLENNSNSSVSGSGDTNQVDSNAAANANTQLIPYPGTENVRSNPSENSNIKVTTPETTQLKPANPAMPAPDNSEIVMSLNEKGAVETRTFKANPVLAKIERTTAGREVQLKVFLKNGKVIALPADKIKNFAAVSATEILQAAGIEPPKPAQNPNTDAATGAKTNATEAITSEKQTKTKGVPPLRMPTRP